MGSTPVFNSVPNVKWAKLTAVDATASKNHDGTSSTETNIPTVFTAGAAGGYVETIKAVSAGTNVASVLRIFINNGSVNTTAANNTLYKEVALDATTLSETLALKEYEVLLGISIDPGYKIMVCLGTAVVAGWNVTAIGADY